mgnify:CR=1 FL=1
MLDFSNAKEEFNNYSGSEKKKTLIYDNKKYLVKFPDPVREKDKKISEYISKIKQEETKIKMLTEKIIGINTEKGELENIVIKQESRVGKLGIKVDKIESLLKNKNDEIRENETYSLKLINIIKEQKNLINNLKKEQKTLEENNSVNEDNITTINSLKAQIIAVKKKLELKEDSYIALQKSHKILQEKYLKLSSNNRKKEQELLTNIINLLTEKILNDKTKDTYHSYRYLYFFLQSMDTTKELKYLLAYIAKSLRFIEPNEYAFNEDKQFIFESIMYSAMTLYNNGNASKAKIAETHKRFVQELEQKKEEFLSRTQELNTAKIQALKELGYTEINEHNASEVFDKIAEIQSRGIY